MTSLIRPLYSIVIPIYKESPQADFLQQITTFIKTTRLHAELILVVDPPTDSNSSWLTSPPPGVKIIPNSKRLGRMASLKLGAQASEGQWIALLSADLSAPLAELITSHPYLTQDPPIDFVFGERVLQKQNAITGQLTGARRFVLSYLEDLTNKMVTQAGKDPLCSFMLISRKHLDLLQQTQSESPLFFAEFKMKTSQYHRVFHPIRWVYRDEWKTSAFKIWWQALKDIKFLKY